MVYGVQRTADAVSAHGDLHMSVSLLTFIVVYSAVFGVGYTYAAPDPQGRRRCSGDNRYASPPAVRRH